MPRISDIPVESMDARMQEEMQRCAREGTPRPESSAVRAHAPDAFWAFADSWKAIFHSGVCDLAVKEPCRVYLSRTVKCEFCGNQRSIEASTAGLLEQQYDELLNCESSDRYDERQKAALASTEAIAWRFETDDAFWERMHRHVSEPELVELGASSHRPSASRAGCGCSTSSITRCPVVVGGLARGQCSGVLEAGRHRDRRAREPPPGPEPTRARAVGAAAADVGAAAVHPRARAGPCRPRTADTLLRARTGPRASPAPQQARWDDNRPQRLLPSHPAYPTWSNRQV